MALQPRVVSQDLVRRQAVGRAAQCARLAREHHRRKTDAVRLDGGAHLRPVLRRRHEMPAVRNQPANLLRHAAAQIGIARAERHHHGFRTFAQETEEPVLQPLLHRTDLVPHSTAQAASGVSAATQVTGAYP